MVRQWFAKPPFTGSNPVVASMNIILKTILTLSLLTLTTITSCSHAQKEFAELTTDGWTTERLLNESIDRANKAIKTKSRSKKKKVATLGIEYADRCMLINEKMTGCYYYHAVNTGLYYEARVLGYQKGLKIMIKDAGKVIELDPSYNYGGIYRILGKIYERVPLTAARPGDITRNLDLSEKYFKKALKISPQYPENRLFLANIQYKLGKDDEAINELNLAKIELKTWKKTELYKEWKKLAEKLENELKAD